ncbi:MAG: molybdopterin cofactor-binding domain-containing protein [Steroidobacteraceae bacterium]
MSLPSPERRLLLQAAVAVSGGLLLRISPSIASSVDASAQFNAYLEITPEGRIRITSPQSEMGQGIHDALAKILAEELEANWSDVDIALPTADDALINPLTRRHRTAASESIKIYRDVMRRIGASAREMLLQAAAERWQVDVSECDAQGSSVHHRESERRLSYGALAVTAAALPVPQSPRFKELKDYRLVGRTTPRKDTPPKVTGRATYGIDVQRPGMLYAALRRSPVVASRVRWFDRERVLARPGVIDAFEVEEGVAIIATSTWTAWQAAANLSVEFDETPAQGFDSEALRISMRRALDADDEARIARALDGPAYDRDATLTALAGAARQAEWRYEVPFLAHAALEPLCATAVVYADRAEVWAPTQQPDRCRDAIAAITRLPRERCTLHVTFLGGGFGRKWETDFVRQAVTIAREVARIRPGTPVKLTWTREQDFLHDRFRPAHVARSRVGLSEDDQLLAVHSRITGPSIFSFQKRNLPPGIADPFATGLLINDFYRIPARLADYVETPAPVPIGTWRSVAQSQNGFFAESTIDDVAALTNRDPWEFRRELCAHDRRAVAVLDRIAELGDWRRPLNKAPENARRGRGISLSIAYGSYCAEIVEVTVVGRRVTIDKIVAVFDCGLMIDPGTVDAQISGGIVFGLSAAIDGEIRFEQGAAVQRNFDAAPVLRMSQTPKILVDLLRTDHAPGGAGEASVPGVAPGRASAIHMATGTRPRRLPLVADGWEFA